MRRFNKLQLLLSITFLIITVILLFYLLKLSPFDRDKQKRLSLINTDILRLDENLSFAKKVVSFKKEDEKKHFKFDFEAVSDLEQWDFYNNEVIIKDGLLYLTSEQEICKFSLNKIDFLAENIENIILRANIYGSDRVNIKYVNEQGQRGHAVLDMPTEGKFYTYKINAANSLRKWTGKIESLTFEIFNNTNVPSKMLLDYIYFQKSTELYSEKVGIDLCKLKDHMRRAIYVYNPSKIEFEVFIPPKRIAQKSHVHF